MNTREGIYFIPCLKLEKIKMEKLKFFNHLFLQLEQIGIPVSTVTSTFDE